MSWLLRAERAGQVDETANSSRSCLPSNYYDTGAAYRSIRHVGTRDDPSLCRRRGASSIETKAEADQQLRPRSVRRRQEFDSRELSLGAHARNAECGVPLKGPEKSLANPEQEKYGRSEREKGKEKRKERKEKKKEE